MANNYGVQDDTINVLRPLALQLSIIILFLIYPDYYHLIIFLSVVASQTINMDGKRLEMLTDTTGPAKQGLNPKAKCLSSLAHHC